MVRPGLTRSWMRLIIGMFFTFVSLLRSLNLCPRISLVPSFPGLRRFPHGRRFKQWTGDDSKALMKVCLSSLHLFLLVNWTSDRCFFLSFLNIFLRRWPDVSPRFSISVISLVVTTSQQIQLLPYKMPYTPFTTIATSFYLQVFVNTSRSLACTP